MPEYKILLENENTSEIQAAVRQGLRDSDPVDLPPRQRDYQPFNLSLRVSDETIIGGLYGTMMWSWLMIDGVWVDEAYRSKGLGSQLLLEAENHAIQHGCRGVWLAGPLIFKGENFTKGTVIQYSLSLRIFRRDINIFTCGKFLQSKASNVVFCE